MAGEQPIDRLAGSRRRDARTQRGVSPMIGWGGAGNRATLLADGPDGQSRHYEKQSARKKRWLDTSRFCRLRRKSTALPAVGMSSGAGVGRRRVHQCDTTTMHEKRRSTPKRYIRNPSYVHPVHPSENRVDAKNRQRAAVFSQRVQASTPKCNVHAELKGKTTAARLSTYKRYASWGGRLDATGVVAVTSCDYLRPPKFREGGRGGRVSGEVTL